MPWSIRSVLSIQGPLPFKRSQRIFVLMKSEELTFLETQATFSQEAAQSVGPGAIGPRLTKVDKGSMSCQKIQSLGVQTQI